MEEMPKENMTGSRGEIEHDEENKGNSNSKQSDDNHKQSYDDDGKHCDNDDEYDVNSAENSFLFTEVDSSTD